MPLCTPASMSGELLVGFRMTLFTALLPTRLVWWWVEDLGSSPSSTGNGCGVCVKVGAVWGEVGWLPSGKASLAFVWLKVLLLKEPMWPVLHPCCFCFQPWEHLGFASGPHKEAPQLHSPSLGHFFLLPPLPQNLDLQGCHTFASKWRAAGTKCFGHIPLAGGAFPPKSTENVLHERS